MKKILVTVILFTGIALKSNACLNIYYSVDKEGHFHETEDYRIGFNTNFNFKLLEKRLIETEKKFRTEKSYRLLSDYAVYLMKAGKLEESLEILIVLAANYPNEYQLAANLGTAYELSGNPDSALVYIKRGIELNPDSHEGSEWVHVKILETKIAQRSQPDYLLKNTVLGLSGEQEKDPEICDQILIQVRERFPFCPGPDSIMASLLVDLGDCYANSISVEYAKVMYQISANYYGVESEELDARIEEMIRLSSQYKTLTTKFTNEGMNNKEENVRYQRMLDDNNDPPYSIQWEKITTNVDTLLRLADLERLPAETSEALPAPARIIDESVTGPSPAENKPDNFSGYLLMGIIPVAGILLWVTFFRKKNSN